MSDEKKSSVVSVEEQSFVPNHIAIIMDGNGRWAKEHSLPRMMGHQRGVKVVREVVKWCNENNILYLSLFAFSTENWGRPKSEVSHLMTLFLRSLKKEAKDLIEKGVKLRVIGNRSRLPKNLVEHICIVEEQTKNNNKLTLIICADYGGHWDIYNAAKQSIKVLQEKKLAVEDYSEEMFAQHLQASDIPPPDLLIRTGGEKRISNFYLWQLAYTELYFCDTYWPVFSQNDFNEILESYKKRVRRFGKLDSSK
jgi:undecaprenyl diphosphate synthase